MRRPIPVFAGCPLMADPLARVVDRSRRRIDPPGGWRGRRCRSAQARSASSANEAMSGNVASGVALAGGVAPEPGRSPRRLIQADRSPSSFAGTWSWNRLWATWRIRSRGTLDPLEGQLEVAVARLVAAGLLGRDDPVERHAEATVGRREQVVVAVRDHREPVAPGKRRRAPPPSPGRPATPRPNRRTPPPPRRSARCRRSAQTPRQALGKHLAVAEIGPRLQVGLVPGVRREQLLVGDVAAVGPRHRPESRPRSPPPSR